MALKLAHASLAVPHRWEGQDTFSRVIKTWRRVAPGLLPTLADDHEPVRKGFDPTDLSNALQDWDSRLWIFRRVQPVVSGSFLGSFGHTNSTAHFTLTKPAEVSRHITDLESLTIAMAEQFDADLAIVHVLTDDETVEAVEQRRPDVRVINRVKMTVDMSTGFSKQLEHGLPTLYWTNIFGHRYENTIGTDRLLSAPWAAIERRSFGVIARVTVDPPNEDSWATFKAARERITNHLGHDLFWPAAQRVPALGLLE